MALTTRTTPQTCPVCRYKLDAVTSTEGDVMPKLGDLTVCIGCATVLIFEAGMVQAILTKEEMAKLPTDTLAHLSRTQREIHIFHQQRRQANAANN